MILTLPQMQVFLLVFARVAGMFIEAPVFSSRTFPATGKVAMAIWIASAMWFSAPVTMLPPDSFVFIIMLLSEFSIGFAIGFVCSIFFETLQSAGNLIDLQMGTSIASSVDPNTGAMSSMIGRLAFFMGLVVFFILNGHHMILAGVHQSFTVMPVGHLINFSSNFTLQIIEAVSSLLLIALQLAVPALLIIFLSDFSFGIVSRVAPQVNVFMLGFQVKPSLGILALLFSAPLLTSHVGTLINQMIQEIIKLLANIR
ncbi:MAG: flagellar biosynthetic protein FliR [Candidatus Margulisiibacteriota bacterium]